MDDVLRRALEVSPPDAPTLHAWWEATRAERGRQSTTIDRAVIGGALADRMGFAFAGGYHEALQRLIPSLQGAAASLCATEESGNHPRAIKTLLTRVGEHYTLTGKKSWATAASDATILLVIASTGEVEGKNQLVLVSVRAGDRGVKRTATTASFVPEIPHAVVELDNVTVQQSDIHPGDGFDEYLKPFRTIEDLHVHGALLGYLLGVARRHGLVADFAAPLAAAIATTRALVADDPKSATTHLALAALLDQVTKLVTGLEARWPAGDERTRWERDRKILQVASSARAARLARARARLGVA